MNPAVERPLTPQQRAALDARDVSVSLSAGAGCGKTFVLTERFLSHVDPTQVEPAHLEELVAITFTDAAAREMRDRIRRRCFERLQSAQDDQEAAAWQRLMRSMDGARISTIHSFCTQLLRSYAVEAGLDPQFEVLDAATAELMKLETVDDRLRALLLAGDEDVLNLAAKRGLDRVRTDVARLAGPLALPAVQRWQHATVDEVVAAWQQYFASEAAPAAIRELLGCAEANVLRRLARVDLVVKATLGDHLLALADALQGRELTPADAHALLERLNQLARVSGVCTAKDWADPEDFAEFRDTCAAFRDRIKKSILKKPFDVPAAREAAGQGLALLRLVGNVTQSLERTKTRRNQLEFDDLLARAHRLLTAPENDAIRREVAGSTRLLMVDEFQDTNPLQVAIIKAFCGDGWREQGLFAVGDFKQSIYRFNGAEPRVSNELRNALLPTGRLSLTRNFRSQPAVTAFVNAVFHQAFEQYEPLVPARPQATPTPAIEFMWTPGENSSNDDRHEPAADSVDATGAALTLKRGRRAGAARDARVLEADWIARRLVQLLQSEARLVVDIAGDPAAPRPLKLGDIAILLRTLSDAQVYEEALRAHGLSYYLAGGHAFYSQQEIYDVLNLFRAVASEVDEIALAGALRSPLFSLADETLYWLVQRHQSLNAALAAISQPPAELDAVEAAKVRRAAATMARLREEKDRLLVADLFALAMELTGYDAVLLTEFLGPRKAANIEKLIEQARTLDRSSPGDLPGFITQLSEFVSRAPKEALAATQSEGDVIRIMTIHYSKGLEFPLVVLPDLDRQRHAGMTLPVLDETLGPLVSIDAEEKEGLIGIDLYRHAEDVLEIEERRRLLYVACTRAADYLLLSSSIDDPAQPKRDWLQLIDQQVNLVDGSLRQPLPAGYEAPQILVTTARPQIDDEKSAQPRGADLETLVARTRQLAAKGASELPRGSDAIPADASARRRFSFSQLTGALALQAEVEDDSAGIAMPSGGASLEVEREARELGWLVHAVLEQWNFQRPPALAEFCESLAWLQPERPQEQTVARAVRLLEEFLASPRGRELASAQIVRREVEFLLPWPPVDQPTTRYLHGYIDCLYQGADGRWRLLDFKTNRVTADNLGTVANQYESQLLVYALAVERALGAPPAEVALVLLDGGCEHRFNWSDADRTHAMRRIDAAMTRLVTDLT
ncbi:UvrD-helicase domain-containing protein [Lacipirellula limnantheis]|uniref:DNA 3'-5' helicase n=1 Tax=Lacipirellula limnantheis TaxID=2528024 RepID=A0A517U0J9_9BACT|nr:UvrD-helicase domain-containing protein [Lacipirellula limnantheis]QDT74133.1 ATP-dependent helicase/nuclease subunit A [Lacipirellula limnantheis]